MRPSIEPELPNARHVRLPDIEFPPNPLPLLHQRHRAPGLRQPQRRRHPPHPGSDNDYSHTLIVPGWEETRKRGSEARISQARRLRGTYIFVDRSVLQKGTIPAINENSEGARETWEKIRKPLFGIMLCLIALFLIFQSTGGITTVLAGEFQPPKKKFQKTPATVKATVKPAFYIENFSDSDKPRAIWKADTSVGLLEMGDGMAHFDNADGGLPLLFTQRNIIPTGGDWTFSAGYRYATHQDYGGAILLAQKDTGKIVVSLAQEPGSREQVITLMGNPISRRPLDEEWHALSVARSGGQVMVYLDGVKVGSVAATVNPDWVVMGSAFGGKGQIWSLLDIQTIQVFPYQTVLQPLLIARY